MSEKKKWTIMVYLSGDNNLSDEMVWSLKEMHRVGTTDDFDVVVWFDPGGIHPQPFKYEIRTVDDQARNSDQVQKYQDGILDQIYRNMDTSVSGNGEAAPLDIRDSADPNVLRSFVANSIREHPAECYALILSGHGSGWRGDFLTDYNPHSSLSIADLGRALSDALDDLKARGIKASINVLGMDSCLMSTTEVCGQLLEVEGIDYLVGSEGFELATGWPYHRILGKLRKKLARGGMEPKELAGEIVDRHFYYYLDYVISGVSTDLSAISLGGNLFKSVLNRIGLLAGELRRGLNDPGIRSAIVMAHLEAQAYKASEYVDLWDFADRLVKQCGIHFGQHQEERPSEGKPKKRARRKDDKGWAAIKDKAAKLKKSIERSVVASEYTGGAFQHSHGISVYFPWSNYLSEYDKLAFAVATGWNDFLRDYVRQTRREENEKYKENGTRLPTYEAFVASRTGTADQIRTGTADQIRTGTADQIRLGGKGGSLVIGNPPSHFWHRQEGQLSEMRGIAKKINNCISRMVASGNPNCKKFLRELAKIPDLLDKEA